MTLTSLQRVADALDCVVVIRFMSRSRVEAFQNQELGTAVDGFDIASVTGDGKGGENDEVGCVKATKPAVRKSKNTR